MNPNLEVNPTDKNLKIMYNGERFTNTQITFLDFALKLCMVLQNSTISETFYATASTGRAYLAAELILSNVH